MGMNSHQSPREDNVREYIKSLQRRDAQRDKDQFADKGRDTLLDGYTEEEFEAVCSELWAQGRSSPECNLRTLVDLMLGHYMLARGGDRRAAEISDLFTFELKGEGPTRCMPLIITTRAGKENQHGRLETMGALRHKQPLVCMLSGLAFYLLYRWDLTDEPFPDFASRPAWYEIRLIKRAAGGDRQQPLSYTSQRDWVAKAFQQVGIAPSKTTHASRGAGAKMAELKGVSEEQIRRAGRWNQEQMVGCYLNSLPREFMRTMAGHPSQLGCFEVRRASVAPPDELLSLIWPELDAWKGRFGPQPDQINDLAATGLTGLLFYLREVALQDSVALRQLFPDNAIWTHPVFQHPAYQPFARQLAGYGDSESQSQWQVLHQAMPQLVDHLKAMNAHAAEREAENRALAGSIAEMRQLVSSVVDTQAAQSTQLQMLTSGGLTHRFEAPTTPTAAAAAIARQLLLLAPSSAIASASAGAAAASPPLQGPQGPQDPQDPQDQRGREGLIGQLPPSYRMSRVVKTVDRLWHEWTIGFGGSPSIQALDSKWGSRWRTGRRSEIQWYSLRLEVIREIRRIARAQRTSEEAAMWQLNLQQQQMGCSLDQLCKRLRAGRQSIAR
jgi:hypothetical protein